MPNPVISVEGDTLTIVIDLQETQGRSASGKSEIVATTSGNVTVPGHPGIKLGLNCYKPV